MADVTLTDIEKTYPGGNTAVSGVSATISDGEFIVLVGPSGCGKSTILRMIAGLETVTSGEVQIAGARVNDLEPGARDIAMVFQNYALYPHMSVRANMAYGLKNEGLPKDQIAARIAEAARSLRLEPYLDRKPRQLSGGQRQRVAMGRAIVRDPAVFLFDEPLSNLDAKLRTQLRGELKDLHRRLGATFIYVTHDQVEAMSLADRILIMSEGRLEQVGTPLEVYERPASRFVADFIGIPSMNFLPATLNTPGTARLACGSTVPLGRDLAGKPGQEIDLGIRPEHLRRTAPDEAQLHLSARLVEHLGADTVVHGTLDWQDSQAALRLSGIEPVPEGRKIGLALPPEHLHAFDRATGQRLGAKGI